MDTLEQLRAEAPGDEHVFVLGADQAMHLPEWREPRRVVELAQVAVADRAGVAAADVRAALAGLGGEERVTFFAMPRVDVSSTEVRARAAAGQPYRLPGARRRGAANRGEGLYR